MAVRPSSTNTESLTRRRAGLSPWIAAIAALVIVAIISAIALVAVDRGSDSGTNAPGPGGAQTTGEADEVVPGNQGR